MIPESQLLKVFPEGKALCKKLLKEINAKLAILADKEWDIEREQLPWKEDLITRGYLIEIPRRPLLIQKKRLEGILRWEGTKGDYLKNKELVLQIPIDQYLTFNNRGFATCLWHEEKTPSMKWNVKRNKVHCFGCGMNGDVIDVVMKMNNVTFKEAYSVLLKDLGLGG